MNLWQAYRNATTEKENNKLENELVKQYQPLISRVWKFNFSSKNYEDSFAQGMVSLWEGIKNWKKDNQIEQQTEKELLNYLARSIFNGIANYWRNEHSKKRSFASSNVDKMELAGENKEVVSEETRQQEARQEIIKLLGGQSERTYEILLEKYGHGESWKDLWEKWGYSSYNSMKEALNQSLHRLQKKAQEAAS